MAVTGAAARQGWYHDGNPKPAFRGFVHLWGSSLAVPLIAYLLFAAAPLPLVLCVAGKAIVYAASAAFHRGAWHSALDERWAMVVDVALVPLAICAGVMPFSEAGGLGVANDLALGAAVLTLNVALVALQFRNGLSHAPGDASARSLVCVAYYLYNELVAGRAADHHPLWRVTWLLYVPAFACAAGVDEFRERGAEPLVLPHHRKGRWSLHEDFHAALLLADVYSGWLGWRLAQGAL